MHLDTAQIYGDEAATGAAVTAFLDDARAPPRSALSVCSNLWEDALFTRAGAIVGVRRFLRLTGLAYSDLYLLHTSRPGCTARHQAWLGLQDCIDQRLSRAIGESNWAPRHVEPLMCEEGVRVLPAVNQVKYQPWQQQREMREYCAGRGIVAVAYSPWTQERRLGDPVVKEVAARADKAEAQVVLHWLVQKEW